MAGAGVTGGVGVGAGACLRCFEDKDEDEQHSRAHIVTTLESHNTNLNIKTNVHLIQPTQVSSWVWTYCGKYPPTIIDNYKEIAVCNICRDKNKLISNPKPNKWEIKIGKQSSTSKIVNHFRVYHNKIWKKHESKSKDIKENSESILSYINKVKNNEQIQRENFIKITACDQLPLAFCESKHFRKFVDSIGKSKYEDRQALTEQVNLKAFQLRGFIKEIYKEQYVSITTDCWTSLAESYMSVTTHFINKNWEMINLTLACELFTGTHQAQDIWHKIRNILNSNGIEFSQVVCCITDNEATNNAAANLMPFNWMGCIAHLLELITRVPLSKGSTCQTLRKARDIVSFFKHSTQAEDRLTRVQENPVHLCQDVSTRWWSTYLMINRLIQCKRYIKFLESEYPSIFLSNDEWDELLTLNTILEPFKDIQLFLEGDYVTSSFIPYFVHFLRCLLKDTIQYTDSADDVPNKFSHLSSAVKLLIHDSALEMEQFLINKFGTGEENMVVTENETRGFRQIRKGIPLNVLIATACDPRTKDLVGIPEPDQEVIWNILLNIITEIQLSMQSSTIQDLTAIDPTNTDLSDESNRIDDFWNLLRRTKK